MVFDGNFTTIAFTNLSPATFSVFPVRANNWKMRCLSTYVKFKCIQLCFALNGFNTSNFNTAKFSLSATSSFYLLLQVSWLWKALQRRHKRQEAFHNRPTASRVLITLGPSWLVMRTVLKEKLFYWMAEECIGQRMYGMISSVTKKRLLSSGAWLLAHIAWSAHSAEGRFLFIWLSFTIWLNILCSSQNIVMYSLAWLAPVLFPNWLCVKD